MKVIKGNKCRFINTEQHDELVSRFLVLQYQGYQLQIGRIYKGRSL